MLAVATAVALGGCAGGTGSSSSSVPSGGAGAEASGGAGASGAAPSAGASSGGVSSGQGGGMAGAPVTTGGASGASGASGAPGASGAGGATQTGRPSGPSAGCGKLFPDPYKTAVEHDLTVTVAAKYSPAYAPRKYYTQLPPTYDGTKPFPVVFYGQGCGQTGPESGNFYPSANTDKFIYVQLIPAAVSAQTVVPSNAAPGCFEAGKEGLADSPDGPYFDQALAELEDKYCVDKGQVFVAGWSSGAWLSTYLACSRGNVIRGAATVAGGLQHDHGTCTGGAAVMMIIGTGDTENGVVDMVGSFDVGTGQARDTFVQTNGCSATSAAWDPAFATCQIYGNCANPVVWCPVPGGHGAGGNIQADAAWKFWMSLK